MKKLFQLILKPFKDYKSATLFLVWWVIAELFFSLSRQYRAKSPEFFTLNFVHWVSHCISSYYFAIGFVSPYKLKRIKVFWIIRLRKFKLKVKQKGELIFYSVVIAGWFGLGLLFIDFVDSSESGWPISNMAVTEGEKPSMLLRVVQIDKHHPVYDSHGQPIEKYRWYKRDRETAQLLPLPMDTVLLQTNATSGIIVRSQIVIGQNCRGPLEPVYAEVLCTN